MEYLNIILLHGVFHQAVGTNLPYIIIGTHTAQSFLPEARPLGPVVVKEMDVAVDGTFLYPRLDGVSIAFAGQYP